MYGLYSRDGARTVYKTDLTVNNGKESYLFFALRQQDFCEQKKDWVFNIWLTCKWVLRHRRVCTKGPNRLVLQALVV